MNYAVMYDYVVDRDSGQWKAPFNPISNEHRVFTYEDTTIVTHNSDTPYSLVRLDVRAAIAKAGTYANDAAEAVYPLAKTLADGSELDGSKHKYTLTFAKDQYPAVNAFWSVTVYRARTQLLIKNLVNRYLINSPMLLGLRRNADGSLTLYIQKDSPGPDKEPDWLPAPVGPIYLVMRLYWPTTQPPSILPPGAGTWQPPGIQQVN